ncbi:MAG: phenylalanine--tRNA ligase subunit beta [Ferruginibacter sp.]
MIISYNWLSEYLPVKVDPGKLSKILTGIGLEVESQQKYESVQGGLSGLITGEIISCEPHPDAERLKVTTVNIGTTPHLQIVCGAPNAASGQKVIVAPIGTTLYPINSEALTIRNAKIRGVESQGMICAEDEIGIGSSHDGIIVLSPATEIGLNASSIFDVFEDVIYEIGLTPNRIDAMSHIGVANDVCAYLSHHENKEIRAQLPYNKKYKADNNNSVFTINIENSRACRRYCGVTIRNITVTDSPLWLQQKIKSIGLRTINNIVDITNFILHESGQPLHAFDADKVKGNTVIIKNANTEKNFITLDEKERKLSGGDLMICNTEEPMCIAGVYGGLHSGVTAATTNIFLESAWFNPETIRQTSVRLGLRTDAATRFEKGVDISNTKKVLERAAILIKEITGGDIYGDVIDVYPAPLEQLPIELKYEYLKKLSGKNYTSPAIKNILISLDFNIIEEGPDAIRVTAPYSKPDIFLPADLVEEIMRIDGLDNIPIPETINISPSINTLSRRLEAKEKIADYLTGQGFYEIFTNSITNSAYYEPGILETSVKMVNNLSAELNIMRPSMLQTGLEVVAHNLNRKNANLQLFEFGKTYTTSASGEYQEHHHLSLYITGTVKEGGWQSKPVPADFYYIKGVVETIFDALGLADADYKDTVAPDFEAATGIFAGKVILGLSGNINRKILSQFDIKEPVFFADIFWDVLLSLKNKKAVKYKEVSKYPPVERALAIIVDKEISYAQIENVVAESKIIYLKSLKLFDIFESDKIGTDKKSMAINFTFLNDDKTLTDKETDEMVSRLTRNFQEILNAEIRK